MYSINQFRPKNYKLVSFIWLLSFNNNVVLLYNRCIKTLEPQNYGHVTEIKPFIIHYKPGQIGNGKVQTEERESH